MEGDRTGRAPVAGSHDGISSTARLNPNTNSQVGRSEIHTISNSGRAEAQTRRATNNATSSSAAFFETMLQTANRIAQGPPIDLPSLVDTGDNSEGHQEALLASDDYGQVGNVRGRTNSFATSDRPRRPTMYSVEDDAPLTSGPLFYNHRGVLAASDGNRPVILEHGQTTLLPTEETSRGVRSSQTLQSGHRYSNSETDDAISRQGPAPREGSQRPPQTRPDLERLMRQYSVARRTEGQGVANRGENGLRSANNASSDDLSGVRARFHDAVDQDLARLRSIPQATVSPREVERQNYELLPRLLNVGALRAARLSWERGSANASEPSIETTATSNSLQALTDSIVQNEYRMRQDILQTRDILRRLRERSDYPAATLVQHSSNGSAHGSTRTRAARDAQKSATSPVRTSRSNQKVQNTVRYLSNLKHIRHDGRCPIALAQEFGIDSMKESLERGRVFDLPVSIDELPTPQYSSWLEPGVSWRGQQFSRSPDTLGARGSRRRTVRSYDTSDNDTLILGLRASRHRERVRLERLQRQRQLTDRLAQNASGGAADSENDRSSSFSSRMPLTNSIEALADMERHISDLLEETETRMNVQRERRSANEALFSHLPERATVEVKDKWPVTVTLHNVDWNKMELTGTMTASHIPDRSQQIPSRVTGEQTNEKHEDATSRIESFFDGEIIDFRRHDIETPSAKTSGYKAGGLGVDIRYWAGIGPFKEEVDKMKHVIRHERQLRADAEKKGTGSASTSSNGVDEARSDIGKSENEPGSASGSAPHNIAGIHSSATGAGTRGDDLDQGDHERAIDEAMIQCLGSRKWLKDNLERDWILMRWKERCFVSPTAGTTTRTNPSSSSLTSSRTTSNTYTPHDNATWGLTISGFYYVALHRQTGRIEGLYYDPGSQPYQRLAMTPTGGYGLKSLKSLVDDDDDHVQIGDENKNGARMDVDSKQYDRKETENREGEEEGLFSAGNGGVRRFFPSIEFR